MKTSVCLLAIITLFLSCEKSSDQKPDLISGKLVSHSDCKNNQKATDRPSSSCIEYTYDIFHNQLKIRHINAAFNCCPDSMYCVVSVIGNEIHINECEKAPLCNCICLFDLEIEIDDLNQGQYKIVMGEPYVEEQNRISFDIDLFLKKEGSYCSERNYYPWSIL
jgi:hypothetical protein